MPELPEVETIVRRFRPRLVGRRISSFECRWARQAVPDPDALTAACADRRVEALERRGKQIVMALEGGTYLLVHLRMSGRFEWGADHEAEPTHVRALWRLHPERETGVEDRLLFCDARKFGRIRLATDLDAATTELGVEPLSKAFTPAALRAILKGRNRPLKALLLDQKLIAGLGNIYTDEALFRARLHPETRSRAVSAAAVPRLHAAIQTVLRDGIHHNGTSIDWIYPGGRMQDYLLVYGRRDQPCPECGAPLQRIVVAQRSTHLCPVCQPA